MSRSRRQARSGGSKRCIYLTSRRLIWSTRAVMCDFRPALSRRARSHRASQSCSRGPITWLIASTLLETRRRHQHQARSRASDAVRPPRSGEDSDQASRQHTAQKPSAAGADRATRPRAAGSGHKQVYGLDLAACPDASIRPAARARRRKREVHWPALDDLVGAVEPLLRWFRRTTRHQPELRQRRLRCERAAQLHNSSGRRVRANL